MRNGEKMDILSFAKFQRNFVSDLFEFCELCIRFWKRFGYHPCMHILLSYLCCIAFTFLACIFYFLYLGYTIDSLMMIYLYCKVSLGDLMATFK